MATLPDERSLGERPAIRTSGATASIGGATGFEGVAARNSLSVANDLTNAGDILNKAQNEYDATVVQDKINQLNSQRLTLESEAKKVMGKDAANPEFYGKQRAAFDEVSAGLGESLTPNQKRLFNVHAQQPALQFQSSMLGHVAAQSEVFAKDTHAASLNSALTQIRTNPDDPTTFNTAIENAKTANYKELSRTGRLDLLDKANQQFEQEAWIDRVDTVRMQDPVRALGLMQDNAIKFDPKQLDTLSKRMYLGAAPILGNMIADKQMQGGVFTPLDPKATTGIPEYDKLPPDWKLHVIGLANQQLSRVTTIADKNIEEMYSQLKTGIPATKQDMARWGGNLIAANRREEFTQFQNEQTNIQALLQSTKDQQLAYRDSLNANMLKGASLKDQARVAGLTSAINTNLKMLDENPVRYASLRLGAQIQPFNASDFSGPDIAEKVGGNLQHRFGVLDANGLPRKPLDPSEAEYFINAIKQSPPDVASKTYGMFRKLAGNDQNYMDLMQQISTGSKIRGYVGILNARGVSAQTGTAMFSDNPSRSAEDITTTLETGLRLLDQSGEDKQDKGKLSMFLPNETKFQSEFSNYMGDAFAGMGKDAILGMQAARTYYAGRASEKGIIAVDKLGSNVDSALLEESIRATIGNIANIGTAKVIAPYGMASGDFQQQARDKFIEQMDAAGKNGASEWGNITLQAVAPDIYKVVSNSGRDPIPNPKTGQPIVLDFRADSMKDQFGRRPSELIPNDVPINATNTATGKIKR